MIEVIDRALSSELSREWQQLHDAMRKDGKICPPVDLKVVRDLPAYSERCGGYQFDILSAERCTGTVDVHFVTGERMAGEPDELQVHGWAGFAREQQGLPKYTARAALAVLCSEAREKDLILSIPRLSAEGKRAVMSLLRAQILVADLYDNGYHSKCNRF